MSSTQTTNDTPELVLMMGLPAAGKGYVGEQLFGNTHQFIDCDSIKESHTDYNPAEPQVLHAWSQIVCAEQMMELFNNPTNAVYDSTGTDTDRMSNYIQMAHDAGMTTRLVFVDVSIETSINRNQNRVIREGQTVARVVPEIVIRNKAAQIYEAYNVVSQLTTDIQRVLNE